MGTPNIFVFPPQSNVWPSAADFATTSPAMAPSAPGRLSTTTGWPRVSESGCAIRRVIASAVPPGANPTTMRMAFEGYCAAAGIAMRPKAATAVKTLFSLQIASLPVCVKPRWSNTWFPDTCWVKASLLTRDSARLFRLESSRASRATPFDELLLQESAQLTGRRAGGFRCLLFELSVYLRALQDDVHLSREPLHDILWRFRGREQPCPRNNGKAWHSCFGDRRHTRKQRAPPWEQRRQCAKLAFLY